MVENVLVGADVDEARRLMRLLDHEGLEPRCVFWALLPQSDAWRLWISPPQAIAQDVFYTRLAKLYVSKGPRDFGTDLGSITFVAFEAPLVAALRRYVGRFEDDIARVTDIVLDGLFIREAIVLRMTG